MTPPADFAAMRGRLFAAIAAAVGLDPSVLARPGTTVVATEERKGRRTAVVHRVGAHALVWCDPAVVDRVAGLASEDQTVPVESMAEWAAAHWATFVGGARSLLADGDLLVLCPTPPGSDLVPLSRDAASDRSLIGELIERSDPDDADAAEIYLDELDPHVVGLLDEAGALGAMASERPWEYDPDFGNIGVLVRSDLRRQGWGRASVSVLSLEVLAEGRFPLYRCNWDREASHRLALSVGFREVTTLAAVHFG